MYCGDDVSAIVGDIGYSQTKVGYAGEDVPKVFVPSTIGRFSDLQDKQAKEYAVGLSNIYNRYKMQKNEKKLHMIEPYSNVLSASSFNNISQPYANSKPKTKPDYMEIDQDLETKNYAHETKSFELNWENVEALWNYSFDHLHIDSTQNPLLLAISTFLNVENQAKYMELMFENFNIPCCYLARDAVLNAFSFGRSNALVIDCGASSTRVVPVIDGLMLKGPSQISCLGSRQINEILATELYKQHPSLNDSLSVHYPFPKELRKWAQMDILTDIKANVFMMPDLAFDRDFASKLAPEPYQLPDGQVIEIGMERFQLPECLMNPNILLSPKLNIPSLPRMIHQAIQFCDADIRRELSSQVILCGGGSLIPGTSERLYREITSLVPSTVKFRFISSCSLEKKFSTFIGGSILASLGSFQQLWASKKEYDEMGSHQLVLDRFQ